MLSESSKVLSTLDSTEHVDAFLSTKRGFDFIFGTLSFLLFSIQYAIFITNVFLVQFLELIEIYGVVQRIRFAASYYSKHSWSAFVTF